MSDPHPMIERLEEVLTELERIPRRASPGSVPPQLSSKARKAGTGWIRSA